ncbi:hypothetical protein K470DRAFT_12862 [Piedraia hortae CBS 480.64]|uniref:P-loop containing nucleoside triphosphate hydrolase protein n=1 Tax=Piedraia hortae CBS 480.64 TaxID=1314780 RepID=A0A6A7BP43_9PEZI|nr:hypothetical protein K470DRAFT_12862 [Piedraia hortae CBS 480.64]
MPSNLTILDRKISLNPNDWTYVYPRERQVPLLVISAGMPRTGTSSLTAALKILGYNDVHHMAKVVSNVGESHYWLRAAEAKFFGRGKPFTKEDWDEVLGSCMATTDMPSAAFADDLIASYPEAKVILNYRDVDAWYVSIKETIGRMMGSWVLRGLALLGDPFLGKYIPMMDAVWVGFFGCGIEDEEGTKRRFREHYEHIRGIVPDEKRYDMRVGEGWVGLCKFLGKDVPNVEYPRVNDREAFAKALKVFVNAAVKRLVVRVVRIGVFAAVVGVGVWYTGFWGEVCAGEVCAGEVCAGEVA